MAPRARRQAGTSKPKARPSDAQSDLNLRRVLARAETASYLFGVAMGRRLAGGAR